MKIGLYFNCAFFLYFKCLFKLQYLIKGYMLTLCCSVGKQSKF